MEFSRDLSILVVEQFLKENQTKSGAKIRLLDGLAGTGARGVRICHETKVNNESYDMTINDHNPLAHKLISNNIELNKITNAIALKNDLNSISGKNKFDYIDIDPFGSPVEFLDAGARMLRNHGILAVTATDTATLFGSYPKTCLRRYDAISFRTPFGHELGLRILIGSCVRIAAKYNLALYPLLVHATDYYYRLYHYGVKGRGKADECLGNLGYIQKIRNSNNFKIISRKNLFSKAISETSNLPDLRQNTKGDLKLAGPLWIGSLYDPELVNTLKIGNHKFGTKEQLKKMLSLWSEEAQAPPGFYDANLLASELKISTPPLSKIMASLIEHGHQASRTHFNPNAFKTDSNFEDVVEIFKNI